MRSDRSIAHLRRASTALRCASLFQKVCAPLTSRFDASKTRSTTLDYLGGPNSNTQAKIHAPCGEGRGKALGPAA